MDQDFGPGSDRLRAAGIRSIKARFPPTVLFMDRSATTAQRRLRQFATRRVQPVDVGTKRPDFDH
jgi:hypothetical protein